MGTTDCRRWLYLKVPALARRAMPSVLVQPAMQLLQAVLPSLVRLSTAQSLIQFSSARCRTSCPISRPCKALRQEFRQWFQALPRGSLHLERKAGRNSSEESVHAFLYFFTSKAQ